MASRGGDSLGQLLRRMGALSEEALEDALEHQRQPLPLASICYVLGYADEEILARVLSRQQGAPAVVLDRSIIELSILRGVPRHLALHNRILPVKKEGGKLFVACSSIEGATGALKELQMMRPETVVPHVALLVTLERALRACFHSLVHGAPHWVGHQAEGDEPTMFTVVASGELPDKQQARAFTAVEDVTKEMNASDLLDLAGMKKRVETDTAVTAAKTTVPKMKSPFAEVPDQIIARPETDDDPTGIKYGAAYKPKDRRIAEGTPVDDFVEPPTRARASSDDADAAETLTGDEEIKTISRDSEDDPLTLTGNNEFEPPTESFDPKTTINMDDDGAKQPITQPTRAGRNKRPQSEPADLGADEGAIEVIDVARKSDEKQRPLRVLIVDTDRRAIDATVAALKSAGYVTHVATDGGAAVRMITSDPPDAVIIDTDLPEVDGFQIAGAIKQSHKYSHIPVALVSARVDAELYTKGTHKADAYFEKPIDFAALRVKFAELLHVGRPVVPATQLDDNFERAIELYRSGKLEDAVVELRKGLEVDPTSARHHFVLANLLQKRSEDFDAIDEYEATVDLKPDYFPALTRLAYLYYKKGYSAKAIETWRRALPHCPDKALRKNIEVFMRKLIADMQSGL
jgi:CheY-like chemotaxis protein